jgi:hypothetical protein
MEIASSGLDMAEERRLLDPPRNDTILLAFCPKKHYNHFMTAGTLRVMLAVFLVAMFVLAMLYLSRRPLTPVQMAAWGLFALLVPALGPFLVILARPGKSRPRAEIVRSRRRR